MIKNLAKKLATLNRFADFVIIEAELLRGHFEESAEILKAHSAMALLRVSSSDAKLSVKMIQPRREIKSALGSRIQTSEKIWRVFTASEISEFTTAVGDQNKIYRLNPPIVPALLILETICAEFSVNFIKVKFKNFITAGEPLTLYGDEKQFVIAGAGVRKVILSLE